MARIYTLANQKGGVGKTTTAVNLGAYLAQAGKRVLLVDVDPQANATSSLGIDKNALEHSIYDALIGSEPLSQLIRLTNCLGLDLVPSAPALAGAEVELIDLPKRELRLKQILHEVEPRYDFVLIDTPPSLGMLTVNALAAAHGVLIPVQCEYLPLEGLSQLLQTIDLVRQSLNPNLIIRGLILTMYDTRTNLSRQVVEEIRQHFGNAVFRAIIPRNIKLSEAPSYGETILTYAPSSSGGQAYAALCEEFLQGEGA
ncbi:MAG: ParA family protein [Anaerolineae bacterium]|nr:ParA family protein [Anaerolineae bacterium]